MPRRGVLYLAVGDRHQHLFLAASRKQLLAVHPQLDQHVITDRRLRRTGPLDPAGPALQQLGTAAGRAATDDAQSRGRVSVTRGLALGGVASRVYKTQLHRFSPFEETLFLDNDAVVTRRLDELWRLIGDAPFAAALGSCRTVGEAMPLYLRDRLIRPEEAEATRAVCAPDAPCFNAGVMLWRRGPESDRLFDAWHEEWRRFRGRDQAALYRALARTQTRVAVLPPTYNVAVRPEMPRDVLDQAHILHFWRRPKVKYLRHHGYLPLRSRASAEDGRDAA